MEGTAVPSEPVIKEQSPVAEEIIIEAGSHEEVGHVIEEETIMEEIVTADGAVYNENGEIVQYQDVMIYDSDGNQQIVEEEYVNLADLDEDVLQNEEEYAYMITDANGQNRIISVEEIRALQAAGEIIEELKPDQKGMDMTMSHHSHAPLHPGQKSGGMKKAVDDVGASSSDMYKARSSNLPRADHYSRMSLVAEENLDLNDFEDALPSYLREKFVRCLSKTGEAASRKVVNDRMGVDMRSIIDKRLSGQGSSRDPVESYMYIENGQYIDEHDQIIEETLEEVPIEEKMITDSNKTVRSHLNDLAKVEVEKNRARKQQLARAHLNQPLDDSYEEDRSHDDSMENAVQQSNNGAKVPYYPRGNRKDPGVESKRFRASNTGNSLPANANFPTSMKQIRNMVAESKQEFEMPVTAKGEHAPLRYNCPECELGVSSLEKLCLHLNQMHDAPTHVRQVEFYSETDFERFMNKIEHSGCNAEEEHRRVDKKYSRLGSSQFFKCNYMSKDRASYPELTEISLQNQAEEIEETCPAFVIKFHNYESLRVKYCDYHLHFDGVVDFRVPILAKRRIFELLYKRLPIPVMQNIISRESDVLSIPGSKSQIRLKNITINETTAILSSIHGSLKTSQLQDLRNNHPDTVFDPSYARITRNGERVEPDEKTLILTIEKNHKPGKPEHDEEVDVENVEEEAPPPAADEAQTVSVVPGPEHKVEKENDAPVLSREEEVDVTDVHEEEVHTAVYEDPHHNPAQDPATKDGYQQLDMSVDELYLYDPAHNRDALIEELTPDELRALESYENDCEIELNEEQKENRMRMRIRFLVDTISHNFLELDTHTHALLPSEHRKGILEELKHFSTATLDIACGLEAEVHCAVTMSSNVEAMKRNLISAVSSKEKRYYTSDKIGMGRRKTHHQLLADGENEHGNSAEDIYSRVAAMAPLPRTMGINPSGTFTLGASAEERHSPPPQLGETIQPRVANPWFPKHRAQKRRPDSDEFDNTRMPNPRKRVRQARKFAEMSTREVVEANLGELMKDGSTVREEILNITTDDNVPTAIAMGVDQEIEISTEEDVNVPSSSTNKTTASEVLASEDTVPDVFDNEIIIGEPIREEEKVLKKEELEVPQPAPTMDDDDEVEIPITKTRTGRVVKQRKWLD